MWIFFQDWCCHRGASGATGTGLECRQKKQSGDWFIYINKAYRTMRVRVKTREAVQNRQTNPTRSRQERNKQAEGQAGMWQGLWKQTHKTTKATETIWQENKGRGQVYVVTGLMRGWDAGEEVGREGQDAAEQISGNRCEDGRGSQVWKTLSKKAQNKTLNRFFFISIFNTV